MSKERLYYLDLAKGFGILLVILGHIEYVSDALHTWIYSFHMPLFFFIAGILMGLKDEAQIPVMTSVKKKFCAIMVPYLWFSLIYLVLDIYEMMRGRLDLAGYFRNILHAVTLCGESVLWFLPALFLSQILCLLIVHKLSAKTGWGIAIVLPITGYMLYGFVLPFYEANQTIWIMVLLFDLLKVLVRAAVVLPFVYAGVGFSSYLRKGRESSAKELVTGIFLMIFTLPCSVLTGTVDINFLSFAHFPLFYICAFSGSIGLVLLCKNMKNLPIISYYGRNSLIVMVTHISFRVLYAAILIAWQIDTVVTRAKSYVFHFNIMIFTCLFEAIMIFIINRFCPFLIGRKRDRKEG